MADVQIVTYLKYSELFNNFEKTGMILAIDSLQTEKDFEGQIEYLLQELNPIEMIQFSSFLNMICQTRTTQMTMVRGVSLLEESGIVARGTGFVNKIVFHRENLLNLITQILIKNINGTEQLTGLGHQKSQEKYTRAILMNNDLLSIETVNSAYYAKEILLRDHFIREWPHYYLSDIALRIYGHRIVRYRYCYDILIPTMQDPEKKVMKDGITNFEQQTGVSLKDYMKVVNGLYGWFLSTPLSYEKKPPPSGQPKLGFDFMNPSSFYIASSLFPAPFMKVINLLSRDIDALKLAIKEEEERSRDPITGYNKNIRIFFDNPIFKISDGFYCVTDLKFLIENICGGLLWRVKAEGSIKDFKPAYGRLIEKYFNFLISNIFKGAKIDFGETSGADAVVEHGNKIFVFEFTTEYYRFSSLYNPSPKEFIDDAYKILFNAGKEDPRSRGKKDKGKLIKLNEYINKHKNSNKEIISILVTENILGDHDMFNVFKGFYDTEITNKNLTMLQEKPPLFLCLDDLETFWSLFDPNDSIEGFSGFYKYWIPENKGPIFHNASGGMCKFAEILSGKDATIKNSDFSDFFSNKNLYKEDEE